jgi:uncharacterized protein (TIGR03435 family)
MNRPVVEKTVWIRRTRRTISRGLVAGLCVVGAIAVHLGAQTVQGVSPTQMALDASPKFEVVTIKPSNPDARGQGFDIQGRYVKTMKTTVNNMITFAYGLHAKQIVGGPDWLDSERFDVDGVPDVAGTPNIKQFRMLIQSLLTDRFKLAFHQGKRELSAYVLTRGKDGPKLVKTAREVNDLPEFSIEKRGVLRAVNVTMRDFCIGMQSVVMDKPVVDGTGLRERYDLALTWTPDASQFFQTGTTIKESRDDPNAPPGLYTAIQEQLGLKLGAVKASVEVMVVDRVERPSEN